MLLSEFIDTYATPMGVEVQGEFNTYEVYLVSIAGIMGSMESCDSFEEHETLDESWHSIFVEKRSDDHYPSLLESIRENGIMTPFCIQYNEKADGNTIRSFHNGNHRLAAAVELGYTHVPIVFINHSTYEDKWAVTQLEGRYGDWAYADEYDRERALQNSLLPEPVKLAA